jgi:hypothetical protein
MMLAALASRLVSAGRFHSLSIVASTDVAEEVRLAARRPEGRS